MARTLEATCNYKILRRLLPRSAERRPATHRIGLITIGNNQPRHMRNEVLKIAAVKLGYVNDRITSVIGPDFDQQLPSTDVRKVLVYCGDY